MGYLSAKIEWGLLSPSTAKFREGSMTTLTHSIDLDDLLLDGELDERSAAALGLLLQQGGGDGGAGSAAVLASQHHHGDKVLQLGRTCSY